MGRFLNPDNSSFQDVINSEIYVDKTGLLDYTNSVINTTSKFICNSRPRRFGKSITADMMAAYYSMGCDSRELFMGYDISKKGSFEKYLNKYDVLPLLFMGGRESSIIPERQTGILSKKLKKLFLFLLSEMVIFLPEKMLSECGNIQVVTELWLPEEQKEIHGSFER